MAKIEFYGLEESLLRWREILLLFSDMGMECGQIEHDPDRSEFSYKFSVRLTEAQMDWLRENKWHETEKDSDLAWNNSITFEVKA